MTIETTTQVYEILVRFEDGSVKGAHVIELETISRDGNPIAAVELPARAITTADIDQIISKGSAGLLAQISEATTENAALKARVAELERGAADNAATVQRLTDKVYALTAGDGGAEDVARA